jgi:hypothetical protein
MSELWKNTLDIHTQRVAFVYLPTNKVFVFEGWDAGGRLYLKAVDPASQDVLPHLMTDNEIPDQIIYVVDPEEIPVENRRPNHESRKKYEFRLNYNLIEGFEMGKCGEDYDAYREDYDDITKLIRIVTLNVQIAKAD